jgi:hypothetical protein
MPTTKISVTIDDAELSWLRRRAKVVHSGNLSAAFAEAARVLRKQEALRAFLEADGVPRLGADELAEIRDEWRPPARRRATGKRTAR